MTSADAETAFEGMPLIYQAQQSLMFLLLACSNAIQPPYNATDALGGKGLCQQVQQSDRAFLDAVEYGAEADGVHLYQHSVLAQRHAGLTCSPVFPRSEVGSALGLVLL